MRRHGRSRALVENQCNSDETSFEFLILSFELARTAIWWGEATDEPQLGQSFSRRLAGTLAPPVWVFVEFVLEPEILKEVKLGYETVLNPDLLLPRIGVDESGKGDFFGPLSIAGVYVNENVINAWKDIGIRDSKNISSDKKIAELAEKIRKTPGCVTDCVVVGNEAYNRLYTKMRSVNTLLAWGHARVIENLLGKRYQMNPPPVKAISDQFAASKSVIEKALMAQGKGLQLVQRHKAEEDIAVAAASILARDEFGKGLAKLEQEFAVKLPKGASAAVDAAAKKFVEERGAGELAKISKLHFRTALRAQGLPEPPKTEWRKR